MDFAQLTYKEIITMRFNFLKIIQGDPKRMVPIDFLIKFTIRYGIISYSAHIITIVRMADTPNIK